MMRWVTGLACLAVVVLAAPAGAHTILGHWCDPEGQRRLIIKGVGDVTLNGKAVGADVDQHHLGLVLPPGEADAGARLRANQITENKIRVTLGSGAEQTWRTFKPLS